MVALDVTIELASPLLLGSTKQGLVIETFTYLPGSVLRGVVAEALLRQWPPDKRKVPHPQECPDREICAFCQVFYPQSGEPPRFGNCYPGSAVSVPFPATTRTCKHHPGFQRVEADPDERHGVFDVLIRQVAFEQAMETRRPLPYVYLPRCPRCREPVKPMEGFYALLGDRFQAPWIPIRRLSRTAIGRGRGTAQEAQLYTLSVLSEEMDTDFLDEDGSPVRHITTLRGQVWVEEAGVEAMTAALRQVERLGGARSRGLGQVAEVMVRPTLKPEDAGLGLFLEALEGSKFALSGELARREEDGEPLRPANLGERLLCFNHRLQAEREFYARLRLPVLEQGWYFTLDLLADAVLHDTDGLPTLRLDPVEIGLAGDGLPEVRLERAFVSRAYCGGWSGAHRLPRQVRLAAEMGGVYLYGVAAAGPEANRRLLEILRLMEEKGIGEGRARGFGRVQVCSLFHLEVKAR